jgi:hypothetical protein
MIVSHSRPLSRNLEASFQNTSFLIRSWLMQVVSLPLYKSSNLVFLTKSLSTNGPYFLGCRLFLIRRRQRIIANTTAKTPKVLVRWWTIYWWVESRSIWASHDKGKKKETSEKKHTFWHSFTSNRHTLYGSLNNKAAREGKSKKKNCDCVLTLLQKIVAKIVGAWQSDAHRGKERVRNFDSLQIWTKYSSFSTYLLALTVRATL